MYALVESGSITKYFNNPKGFTLGDIQYPADIFMKWSVEEKEAIGIYEVVFDNSNKKDKKWYVNTNQSFNFADGKVTASYGIATPRPYADVTETIDGVEYITPGLKTNLITDLKINVQNELAKTDWYIIRNTEKSTAIPSNISTHRDAVRAKQAEMETAIINASDTAALETLHTYVNTGTEENPVMTRPLGELPKLES
jgi:hypothetical protein